MLMIKPSCQYVHANCNPCSIPVNTGVFEITCKSTQGKKNNGLLRNPCHSPCPGESPPAQPCPPFTCTHPFQPPIPARTLSSKFANLSTLALFWILNSLCTSQLWKPYAVVPRVRLSLTRSVVTRTPLNLSSHKTSVCGNQCITSLSPEPVLHSQRHRHQKNAN